MTLPLARCADSSLCPIEPLHPSERPKRLGPMPRIPDADSPPANDWGNLPSGLMVALSQQPRRPSPSAVEAAGKVFDIFKRAAAEPQKTAVSRDGSVVFTFYRDLRFAIYECDSDGDVVLTLTDRGSDAEASVNVMKPTAVSSSIQVARSFLG
jgi:hypothetical protein